MSDAPWLASAARPVTAAGALVRDPAGRVLLVEPTYKPTWEVPGGLRLPADELASAEFVDLDEVDRRCGEPLARRVRAAVEAAETGVLVELKDGRQRRP